MSEPDLPPLRDVIERHDLRAKKALGQNFLLDINLTRRIARAAGNLADTHVIEVGPGPGGLTRALLLEGAAHVTAIERDARCLSALAELADAFPGRLTLVEGDALATDMTKLADGPAKIVANLPYNIATPLLTGWLSAEPWPPWYDRMILMFQREVAERITARPDEKPFGRLGVLAQWRCEAEILFDVDRRAFTPPPKITSSVVSLKPRAEPLFPARRATLEKITAAAFGQRRKMLRSALKSLVPDPEDLLARAGIAPTARAEELDLAAFGRLAFAYDDAGAA